MAVAFVFVLIAVGSVVFHVLSPWWWTPIASNWRYIDNTIIITFWITGVVFVAVKDTAGQIWLAERRAGTWSAWRAIAGLTSDAAPALVFKADDNQVWLFARDRQNGAIRFARVDGGRC